MDNKVITLDKALKIYLNEDWYNLMPFEDNKESDFITLLENKGFIIQERENIKKEMN